ncbi:MAG: hypothetical protein GEU80_05100 [Dehalococcoidia bacterium]|nr:hypothetical protein [Dehalococcoidia bacterium]
MAATMMDSTDLHVTFDDFEILDTEGVDVFVLNLNEYEGVPPFYVHVDGRRFVLQGFTYEVRGHGAQMPQWITEQEAEGRLVLLGERADRYLVYLHDPVAEAEAAAEEAEEAAG